MRSWGCGGNGGKLTCDLSIPDTFHIVLVSLRTREKENKRIGQHTNIIVDELKSKKKLESQKKRCHILKEHDWYDDAFIE